jgi:transcriptional regulator with XRE-family HTH domain
VVNSPFDPPVDDAAIAALLASVGVQVRDARHIRQWHLSDLALRIGVSTSVICRLELARREPSIHQLISVCAALSLRPSRVFRVAEDDAFPLGRGPWTGRY